MRMTSIRFSFDIPMSVAIVLAEVVSSVWYSTLNPFDRDYIGKGRFFITAVLTDIGLVLLLKYLIQKYWYVRGWQEGAKFSAWMALVYGCLEAPYVVYGIGTLSHFLFHMLHKFSLIYIMILVLIYFKPGRRMSSFRDR